VTQRSLPTKRSEASHAGDQVFSGAVGIAMTANEGLEPAQKAPRRRKSLLNLHRMKQFQRLAGPLDALERRLLIWARTPAVSTRGTVCRPGAEDAKRTPQPEARDSETPAKWALRRIPAQSPK